ncbi:enolase-phosphatase E1 isoform X4 [Rhipicephalus microplus]|uniref:enolase-phosphatase E1 isoform X4 n=1 Tax=Rhipicephalus microplus TaxID=6941 RepID=UPI003F6B0779
MRDEIQAVVLDIEGTVISVNFVKAIQDAKDDGSVPPVDNPVKAPREALIAQLEANLLWQMDADRKAPPLKALQGLIWKEGYASGQLCASLYLDVVPMLATWKSRHLKLLIYSSGSVQAQQLLFSHTTEGDVTRLLDGYFDINTAGVKTDARSYEVISQAINTIPSKILFLTDIVADVLRCCLLSTCQTRIARSLGHRLAASRSVQEAQAARRAGFQVRLVVRPGNKPLSEDEKASFSCIGSLEQIEL